MAGKEYQYMPLMKTFPAIRLVQLLPIDVRGEIRLSLQVTPLEPLTAFRQKTIKRYTAISYTWGSPTIQRKVWIDDKYLLLRENIWNFLHHCSITDFPTPKWLWIDSICINQNDIPEKNYQVALMGEIFSKAERVLIWLGDTSAESGLAYLQDELQSNGHELKDLIFIHDPERKRVDADGQQIRGRHADELFPHIEMSESLRKHIMNRNRLNAIVELTMILFDEYWRRIWIVQELVLAKTFPDMVSGVSTMSFETIMMIEQNLFSYFNGQFIFPGQNINMYSKLHLVSFFTTRETMCHYGKRNPLGIKDLLIRFGRQGSTDSRDRVYALIAMTRWDRKFDIDYACPLLELFIKALRCIVEECDDTKPDVAPRVEILRPKEARYPYVDESHILRLTRVLRLDQQRLPGLLSSPAELATQGLTTLLIPLRFQISWYYVRRKHIEGEPLKPSSQKVLPINLDNSDEYKRHDLDSIIRRLCNRLVPDPDMVLTFGLMNRMGVAVRYTETNICSICYVYRRLFTERIELPQVLEDWLTAKVNEDELFWERLQTRGIAEIRCHWTPLEFLTMLNFKYSVVKDLDLDKITW